MRAKTVHGETLVRISIHANAPGGAADPSADECALARWRVAGILRRIVVLEDHLAPEHRDASPAHRGADAVVRAVGCRVEEARPAHRDALHDVEALAGRGTQREEKRREGG